MLISSPEEKDPLPSIHFTSKRIFTPDKALESTLKTT
jgi:hypothetical protein